MLPRGAKFSCNLTTESILYLAITLMDDVSTELESQHARSQKALIEFLQADLNVAFTILRTAELTSSAEHRTSALEKVRRVLQAVRTFQGRIEDPELWTIIHRRTDELAATLESFG
jgi:hypothetical protein